MSLREDIDALIVTANVRARDVTPLPGGMQRIGVDTRSEIVDINFEALFDAIKLIADRVDDLEAQLDAG